MTRVLFFGDLAHTGFGTVTSDLGQALIRLGLDMRFVSQNPLGELPEWLDGRVYIAEDRESWMATHDHRVAYGVLSGKAWPDGWKPEAVIALGDIENTRNLVYHDEDAMELFGQIPTFHYVPIEGIGLSPALLKMWNLIHPVAMSELGATEIAKLGIPRPTVVYHGIDTEAFFPVSAARPIRMGLTVLRSKEECKAYLGLSTKIKLILRTDSNWPRKNYGALFRALEPVLLARPDVLALFHCKWQKSPTSPGADMRDLHAKLPTSLWGRVGNLGYHDKGIPFPREMMTVLYNAADLYVSTSAEGFGLTIAEALACGVPAVGLDYSSVPEVIGPAGRLVKAFPVDNEYAYFWAVPHVAEFTRIVGELLDDDRERGLLGAKGPHHVKANFQWDHAAAQFSELIEAAVKVEVAA